MVLEAIPKTAAGRPPTFSGPPIGTTFSNEPDDRDDMLTHLDDNVKRLVDQARHAPASGAGTFLRLLEQRRAWVKGELDAEGLLNEPPRAPLGIAENVYDLASLSLEPVDQRRRTYERMLETIDGAMASLWEHMLDSNEPSSE